MTRRPIAELCSYILDRALRKVGKELDAQASLAPARALASLCRFAEDSSFCVGPFRVLKEAIDRLGANSDSVWDGRQRKLLESETRWRCYAGNDDKQ